jgi:HSP20 family protein
MRLVPYVWRRETPARLWPESRSVFPEMSRLFDDVWGELPGRRTTDNWLPRVDVLEKDGHIVLRCELPGMDEKEIDLKLEGSVLTIKGEKKFEKEQKEANYHRVESFHGTFSRSFTLPDSADAEKIKAEYKNGILTVTVPHKPEARPREIPVTT